MDNELRELKTIYERHGYAYGQGSERIAYLEKEIERTEKNLEDMKKELGCCRIEFENTTRLRDTAKQRLDKYIADHKAGTLYVYVVTSGSYEDYSVVAVCRTEARAMDLIASGRGDQFELFEMDSGLGFGKMDIEEGADEE